MTVSGTLDLGDDDTLIFAANPYLLRPNIGLAEEYGSLPLVEGTITGSFDTLDGVVQDIIGWSEYTGAFTDAASLPVNTYYLEQTGSEITFHYKVEGTVPEPGTVGLLGLGILLIRRIRSLQKGRSFVSAQGFGGEAAAPRGFYD